MPVSRAELERELDRLYELPLSEFTSARDELVKRLRADGERERAEQVKRLRKPPAAVWLVNRLARERELDVQRLAKAGAALAKSQKNAASGGRGSNAFLEARGDEQRALERLAQAARETAAREGVSASVVDRATQTLRAAALTDEGRELLKRARLTEELTPPGFEAFTGLAEAGSRRAPRHKNADPKKDAAARRQALKEATDRVRGLRRQERELETAARAAELEASRTEKLAAELREQADEARAAAEESAAGRSAAENELEQLK